MNERFKTNREDWRPAFNNRETRTRSELRAYAERLLAWSNDQPKEIQNEYVPFGREIASLIKGKEEPTEEQLESLQEKFPIISEKRDRLSPEVLGRYHNKIKAHLAKLREEGNLTHSELYDKASDKRNDNYAALYGRLNILGSKIEKLEKGEVNQEELQSVYEDLTSLLETVRNDLVDGEKNDDYENEVGNLQDEDSPRGEGMRELEMDIPAVDEKKKQYGEVSPENLQALAEAYEQVDNLNEKIQAAVELVQAEVYDLQDTFSKFETESEIGQKQAEIAIRNLSDRLNSFISTLNSEIEPTEESIENQTAITRHYLNGLNELITLQNQRYKESNGELSEFIPELKQYLGLMRESETEIDAESYNQLSKLVTEGKKDLIQEIDINEELSDEGREQLRQRVEESNNNFFNSTGGIDEDGQETSVSDKKVSISYEKWLRTHSEIMRILSPEYKRWQDERHNYLDARNELHKELATIQEKNRSLWSIFRKADTSRADELGSELEVKEQRYVAAAETYYTTKLRSIRNSLLASGRSPEEVEAYIKSKTELLNFAKVRRGAYEGRQLAAMEGLEGSKVMERVAELHAKFQEAPRWKKYAIGTAVIVGTPAALSGAMAAGSALAGGAALTWAGVGLPAAWAAGRSGMRYGIGRTVGALTGFSFARYVAEKVSRKHNSKIESSKLDLSQYESTLKSPESKTMTAAEIREAIRVKNIAIAQALRDQKVKAQKAGILAGAGVGAALGFGTNAVLHNVVSDFGNLSGVPVAEGAISATEATPVLPSISKDISGYELPKITDLSDPVVEGRIPPNLSETIPQTEFADAATLSEQPAVVEVETNVGSSLPKVEIIETEVLPDIDDSVLDSKLDIKTNLEPSSSTEPAGFENNIFQPQNYIIERGDTIWDWAEGQIEGLEQPPVFAEVQPDRLQAFILDVVKELNNNPDLAKEVGIRINNNPNLWLFENDTLSSQQQSLFAQVARDIATSKGYIN